jgi:hypothetical protein
MKVEAYLRFSGIPYDRRDALNPAKGEQIMYAD